MRRILDWARPLKNARGILRSPQDFAGTESILGPIRRVKMGKEAGALAPMGF